MGTGRALGPSSISCGMGRDGPLRSGTPSPEGASCPVLTHPETPLQTRLPRGAGQCPHAYPRGPTWDVHPLCLEREGSVLGAGKLSGLFWKDAGVAQSEPCALHLR